MIESAPAPRRWARVVASASIAALGLLSLAFAPPLLAAVGAVGLGVAFWFWPWLVVPVVVATLPYYLHPRSFAGIELSMTEATILLSVAAVLARAAAGKLTTPHVRMPRASAADWGAAAILAAALLSMLVTEYPKQSLRELRWLIVEPLMIFYVARATIASAQQVRAVLWTIAVSGAVVGAVALVSLAIHGELTSPIARAMDPYLSPNHLGLFRGRAGAIALALAVLGGPAVGRKLGIERVLGWTGLAAIGAGVFRTLSLGAWAGIAAAVLAVTALNGRRWVASTVVCLLLLLVAAWVVLPSGRTTGRLDPTTGTALFRLQIWTSSLRMIADHPLLGVGLDNFLYQYHDGYMLPEAAEEPNISHPHNWLLNFWLELGLLGVVAAVGLLIWVGRTAWQLVRRPAAPGDRLLGVAAIGVFADTLVHGSLDNSYFLVDAAVLWWLIIALLVIRSQVRDSHGITFGTGAVELPS